ncbi:class I SAM-dependent methyltransferase [Streptomyces sp. NPDC101393]|uniref:class I SAM-dependent methyltransferase n=1 Tax=Streptomyces sp. NPDC101393 TaxID=3366141 RepID=UPI003803F0F8
MPFDHNDHYHRLVLRQVPRRCRTALDVGCGTGRFARRLARLGIAVHAVDRSAAVIEAARAASAGAQEAGGPRFEQADVTELDLPAGHYDLVSALASLHHLPFGTVGALRAALAPGGVLVILGCYAERSPADLVWSLAAVPVNAGVRLALALAEGLRRATGRGVPAPPMKPPVEAPTVPLAEIRRQAAVLLPGCTVRRLLFWRYLLVFRNEDVRHAGERAV